MVDTTSTSPGSPHPTVSGRPKPDAPGAPAGSWRATADAGDFATALLAAIGDNAAALFAEQRDRAADEIAAFGELLRRSAQSLDPAKDGAVARYADIVAGEVGAFAGQLHGRAWEELAGDVEQFARGRPMAFLASALCAGFVAVRFLAFSADHPSGPGAVPAVVPQGSVSHDEPLAAARDDAAAVPGAVYPGYDAGIGEDG